MPNTEKFRDFVLDVIAPLPTPDVLDAEEMLPNESVAVAGKAIADWLENGGETPDVRAERIQKQREAALQNGPKPPLLETTGHMLRTGAAVFVSRLSSSMTPLHFQRHPIPIGSRR